jgi:hypothetical protein
MRQKPWDRLGITPFQYQALEYAVKNGGKILICEFARHLNYAPNSQYSSVQQACGALSWSVKANILRIRWSKAKGRTYIITERGWLLWQNVFMGKERKSNGWHKELNRRHTVAVKKETTRRKRRRYISHTEDVRMGA